EGAGEQCKAQRLHEKDGIDHERRRDEQRHHHRERHAQAPGRLPTAWQHPGFLEHALHHAFRPKRPAGRMSSTIAMMTKITVFEASGKNTLVSPSMMPSVKPVRIAPMIEPMPPITTTANTTMIKSEPICGETL